MKRKVLALQVSFHLEQSLNRECLQLATFFEPDGGWKLEASDTAARANTGRQYVLASGINVNVRELSNIQVGWLLGGGAVSSMTSTYHRVEELLECLIRLLAACYQSYGLDVRVSWVVNTGLHALGQSGSTRCLLAFKGGIDGWGEALSKEVGMLGEIGHDIWVNAIGCEGGILFFAVVGLVATSKLDPFGEF